MEKKKTYHDPHQSITKKAAVWDCDSSLYDSFELKSFKQQLDSAIASRTQSMPRMLELVASEHKKPSKIAILVRKLIQSVFRGKRSATRGSGDYGYVEHDQYSGFWEGRGLATIPEMCEKGLESPELGLAVRKTASERFPSHVGVFR